VAHGLSDLPSGITLRTVGPNDRDLLLRVYASTREEELRPVPWSDAEKETFLRSQFEAQDRWWHDNYEATSWDVIEVDGRPAGRLYVSRWPAEIRIVDIALLPEFRGRGVGETLLRRIIDEAAGSGRAVSIHVETSNPARRLYERLGFEEASHAGVYALMVCDPKSMKGTG
jgi:ribosomal protein S18 acetylase RimI-like enzyme